MQNESEKIAEAGGDPSPDANIICVCTLKLSKSNNPLCQLMQ